MASIHRRRGSPYWVCAYTLPNGRRKQISSRTTDRYEARQLADKLEGLGHRFDRRRALKIVDEIAESLGERLVDTATVKEYFEHWFTLRKSGFAASTQRNFRTGIDKFCERYGKIDIALIGENHIRDYRDHIATLGRTRKTIKWHLELVGRILADAVDEQVIAVNPAEAVTVKVGRRSTQKQPFTLAQFRDLLAATDGEWRLLIMVAGLTGQRLRDCLNLTWDCVQPPYIHFRRQKNQDSHVVPIHPELQEALCTPAEGLLFPSLSQHPSTGDQSVSGLFRTEILPRIGIVQAYQENMGGNKQVTPYSFHSLRHMLSTELNSAGVSEQTRMLIVGHAAKAVSARYTHANLEDARNALNLLTIANQAPETPSA